MTRRRWIGLAVSAAAVVSVMSAGATALAASQAAHTTAVTHGNYRGSPRAAHVAKIAHGVNYRGPARPGRAAATVRGSNLPASVRTQRQSGHTGGNR
jgi:hypothetical protein